MPTPQNLRKVIRSRISAGKLPRNEQLQFFGGKGSGGVCACCGQLISAEQIEYEVVAIDRHGEASSLVMHLSCFDIWTSESSSPTSGGDGPVAAAGGASPR